MPRKKSKRAKRKLEKLKLEGQSPGRQGASKYVKKISNVFSKLIKYINEWNEIELSSQQTFSSISNLSERLPMLRDMCKIHYSRHDISDLIDANNIVNEAVCTAWILKTRRAQGTKVVFQTKVPRP